MYLLEDRYFWNMTMHKYALQACGCGGRGMPFMGAGVVGEGVKSSSCIECGGYLSVDLRTSGQFIHDDVESWDVFTYRFPKQQHDSLCMSVEGEGGFTCRSPNR